MLLLSFCQHVCTKEIKAFYSCQNNNLEENQTVLQRHIYKLANSNLHLVHYSIFVPQTMNTPVNPIQTTTAPRVYTNSVQNAQNNHAQPGNSSVNHHQHFFEDASKESAQNECYGNSSDYSLHPENMVNVVRGENMVLRNCGFLWFYITKFLHIY